MDRIKKIKIKQQDGTMSDYYPIGADASNVDIDYNNSTLEVTMKKTPRYYENVASMKLDDTLQEGDMAITLGYYTANDGGRLEYLKTENDYVPILLSGQEYPSICFGDNITEQDNDTTLINSLINISSTYKIIIKFQNKQYNTTGKHKILSNTKFNLNGATLKLKNNSNNYFFANLDNYSSNTQYIENIEIYNGIINGNAEYNLNSNLATMFLVLYYGYNIQIHDLVFNNCERNTFNIFDTSNSHFWNLEWHNLCLYDSEYIHGGNYCLMFENTSKSLNTGTKGKNILIENILIDTYASCISHIYKYDYVIFKNIQCLNPVAKEQNYMRHIPITFTTSTHCEIENLYVENVNGQGLEINAGTEFLTVKNSYLKQCHWGVIFGNNGSSGMINKNISFENCIIEQSDNDSYRAIIYNYSQDVFFYNCIINGIVSGQYELGPITFDNCFFNYKTENTHLYNLRTKWYLSNCTFNNNIKVHNMSNFTANVSVYYELDGTNGENEKDINLAILPYRTFNLLEISSYAEIDDKQNWCSIYPLTRWWNTDTISLIDTAIYDNGGASYRKVTPSMPISKNIIHLQAPTNNNVKIIGCLKLN